MSTCAISIFDDAESQMRDGAFSVPMTRHLQLSLGPPSPMLASTVS
jgi:hypothetical protein